MVRVSANFSVNNWFPMDTKPLCHYLPEEVIEQILVKISCTKSLLKYTLVCKSWWCLIKSSQFINTHLSGPNNTKYLLCRSLARRDGEAVDDYSLYSDSEPSENCVTLVFPRGLKHAKVHGCCNGVICYTKSREIRGKIYLWNPSVGKLKILPKFRKKYYHKDVKETIGFWFDEEKSDYNVVKITYTTLASSVDVYSLRSDSWKIISDSCPGIRFSVDAHNLVYAKGTLHWLAIEAQGWRIVSLDMNNAKFREAFISTSFWAGSLYLKAEGVNSLVILRRFGLSCECIVKVHDQSLELLYTNSDKGFNEYYFLVGFRNNGEALLRKDTSVGRLTNTIVSYDFGAKRLTNFVFCCNGLFAAQPFVETLVLLNESDADVFGWERMVGTLKTIFVRILICKWFEKF